MPLTSKEVSAIATKEAVEPKDTNSHFVYFSPRNIGKFWRVVSETLLAASAITNNLLITES